MNLSRPLLLPPRMHCSRMQTCASHRGLPQMTFHLWLLILSSLHIQPALSELVFSTRPGDGVGVLGSPLTLHCAAYDSRQQRALSVSWGRTSGEPAATAAADLHQMADGSLFFPRLAETDLGEYVCRATSGTDHITASVQVVAADLGAVFHSPQSQAVSESQAVSLQCVSGDSSPPALITWLRDGTLLTTGKQIQGQYAGGSQRKTSGTLLLSNVSLEDEGRYVCVTHNFLLNTSRESSPATLTVLGVPKRLQITQGPDNTTVAVATEASMLCVARGFPVPTVHWFKDGRPLANTSGVSLLDNGRLLFFRNVFESDEGFYHCEARNQRETVRSQAAFLLPAVMDWAFVKQPSNQTVRRGGRVTLACRPPHSKPPAQLTWFRNNTPLVPQPHFTVAPRGELIFHSVQETDSGSYFCRASNPHLHRSVTSRRVTLDVLAPPTVKLSPLVATVPVGAQVVFQCQVWGHPLPSIRWHKQGRYTETGGRTAVGMRNASLSILSVRGFDEGMYTCEASNAMGRAHSTATLRVAASPVIVSLVGQVWGSEGTLVVLPCRAVGVLPISYTWRKGDVRSPIASTQERRTDDEGALRFTSVRRSDAGEYHCTAQNRVGRQQRSFILTVTDDDDPAGTDKQIRQVLSPVADIETEQKAIQANGFNSVEQNYGMAHNPQLSQHRQTTVQASDVDLTTQISRALGNSLPLTSPWGTTNGLTGPYSRLLLGQPSANPAQTTDSLSSNFASPYTQAPGTQRRPLATHHQPPLTFNQRSVTHPRSLTHTQPQNTKYTPLIAGFQHQVSHELTQPPAPVAGVTRSSVILPSQPKAVLPTQDLEPFIQSAAFLLPSTKPLTQSLSEAPHLQSTVTIALFSAPQGQSKIAPTQPPFLAEPQPSQTPPQPPLTQPVPSLAQPQPSQTPPQPPLAQPVPSQGQPQPSLTQPQSPLTQSVPSLTQPQPPLTQPQPSLTQPQPPLTQSVPSLTQPQPPLTQPQPSLTQPQPPLTQSVPSLTQPQPPLTQSVPSLTQPQPPLTQPQPSLTQPQPPLTQPQPPLTQPQPTLAQPQTTLAQPQPSLTQPVPSLSQPTLETQSTHSPMKASISTTYSHNLSPGSPTSDPQGPIAPKVTTTDPLQPKANQSANPAHPAESAGPNDSEPTGWLRKNTSQSTMRTGDDRRATPKPPSWLPVLEKHDIPIVVGVGVSLAFIFITMAFYSLVQKNEPTPIGRGAQRNLGVPCRHGERLATGRTYENRAFEDDDLVAVIEQSPNTSDTRARAPGPSPVAVQVDPSSEELPGDPLPEPEPASEHSFIAETYPEPSQDTLIDSSLDEEKGCALSPPSIQLQRVEDWGGGEGEYGPFRDALPPLSPTPSRSPSPSPPSGVHVEGLRSSLTLHTSEPCGTPVHHSLSISHGNAPLLLSHCVSLGPTTVAVDVHFLPAASAASATQQSSTASATATLASQLSSRLAHSQENDLSVAGVRQSK